METASERTFGGAVKSIAVVPADTLNNDIGKQRLMASGGVLGAVAASSCCVLPLVLFSLGAGGPWLGKLTALSPYQPIFVAITIGFLGYGYWLTYRKSGPACADGKACARPLPNRIVKTGLWLATVLVLVALAWPTIVPLIYG